MESILEVKNINFSYKCNKVLKDIGFNCDENGVVGLLGPNGAGKTTLMKIIVGLKKLNKEGSIKLKGQNISENYKHSLKNIGYLPQDFQIYNNVTGLDFLNYVCDIKGIDKKNRKKEIDKIVESFNLKEVINKNFGRYSGGYKRRLGIAQAIIGNPSLIIIDEPTVGLDPAQRIEFREYLSKVGNKSLVIISTHIIEDIEGFCKNVIMLNNGKISFNGSQEKFIKISENKIYEATMNIDDIKKLHNSIIILEKVVLSTYTVKLKILCKEYIPIGFNKVDASLENSYLISNYMVSNEELL